MMSGIGCRAASFGLNHEEPHRFVEPVCGGRSLLYLIYRWICALYFFGVIITSWVVNKQGVKWLIWLTYWSFSVLVLNTILQAIATNIHFRRTADSYEDTRYYSKMPVYMKALWVLNNITVASAPLVTAMYWAVVYAGWELGIVNLTTHGVNMGYVAIDMLVSGVPLQVHHFFHPMMYAVAYGAFSAIYWAAGGTNDWGKPYIYSALDYGSHAGVAVSYLLSMVASCSAIYLICSAIYYMKVYIVSSCCAPGKVGPLAQQPPIKVSTEY